MSYCNHCDQGHEEAGDGADHQDHGARPASDSSNMGDMRDTMKMPAVTMVAAVDQGRNGRRAFHGIRQPDVQGELRRLAHGRR